MKKEDFENYFENLSQVITNVPPENILNYDETNLSDDPGQEKLIFKRGKKYPERIQNYSKGVSALCLQELLLENYYPAMLFTKLPICGTLGQLEDHAGLGTIARKVDDVAFCGPLKRKILKEWKLQNTGQATLPKDAFPRLLKELEESLNLKNLVSGFKTCGIYPLNAQELLRKLPSQSFPEDINNSVSNVLEQLKSMRDLESSDSEESEADSSEESEADSSEEGNSISDPERSDDAKEMEIETTPVGATSLKELTYDNVSMGQWVKVLYEDEVFLGKVQRKVNNECYVQCI
ncbi:jerky homolog-like [Paramuricea clavata]|uniref:Jerky homolog-like n=1 Tax=Paramuricea clavata TaxID=317549 RepID=A0A6S7JPL9_PARCT|nr:jerky homolog-like [Paramuricea clavata]